MRVLLVHGMGRTPLSMGPLARALRRAGIASEQFGYVAAWQPFEEITSRIRTRLIALADDDCIVIGHSLGGLLLRASVATLPHEVSRPRRIIMLATPNHSPRLARYFKRWLWYRAMNGDSGQWLADESHFDAIPPVDVPVTVIAGTRGINGRWSPFGAEQNDGLVAVSETALDGADESFDVYARHPFVMNHPRARELVLERCR